MLGEYGTKWHCGLHGDLMTGTNELSETIVDALKIPPDTRQQVI